MMSDISLWGRLKRSLNPPAGVATADKRGNAYLVSNSQKVPVVRYVDSLLGRLIERREDITLRASVALPEMGTAMEEPLAYGVVVNRLKVLSGLYPVAYPQPTEGRFRHVHRGRQYKIGTSFDDRGETASCRLSVTGPEALES